MGTRIDDGSRHDFNVVLIGGGPGGYVAAIRAAQLGARVALVERDQLGGVCLNWGCIPTKALLHAAETWRNLHHAETLGLRISGASFDFPAVMARSRDVASRLSRGVHGLLAKNGVSVIEGHGRLVGDGCVEVSVADTETKRITARHLVIATGARPRELPGLKPDGEHIWSSREALATTRFPKSLLIVGAGAIGMEFASFFGTFGSKVTVVEALDRVLPQEDGEVSAHVGNAYRSQGIDILTDTRLNSLVIEGDTVVAELLGLKGASKVRADAALIAIGVVGHVADLGLEKTRVKVEDARIVADAYGATADPRVHAIGDVTGAPWLAHRAMHQGIACVERILGHAGNHPHDPHGIPSCTYGHPQTASIGWTERAAREHKLDFKVGKFPLAGNGKAVASGDADGFVKTLVDANTGEILGAHLVGPGVTELIGAFSVARALEGTDDALASTVWPHPTLSESLHEAVLAASSRQLHM